MTVTHKVINDSDTQSN